MADKEKQPLSGADGTSETIVSEVLMASTESSRESGTSEPNGRPSGLSGNQPVPSSTPEPVPTESDFTQTQEAWAAAPTADAITSVEIVQGDDGLVVDVAPTIPITAEPSSSDSKPE